MASSTEKLCGFEVAQSDYRARASARPRLHPTGDAWENTSAGAVRVRRATRPPPVPKYTATLYLPDTSARSIFFALLER